MAGSDHRSQTTSHTVTRLTVVLRRPYDEVTERFEKLVPAVAAGRFSELDTWEPVVGRHPHRPLVVMRNATGGNEPVDALKAELGIADDTLSRRLNHPVEHGLLTRTPYRPP